MADLDWAGLAGLVMVVPDADGEVRTVPAAVVQMDAGPAANPLLVAQVKHTFPHWLPVASPVTGHPEAARQLGWSQLAVVPDPLEPFQETVLHEGTGNRVDTVLIVAEPVDAVEEG